LPQDISHNREQSLAQTQAPPAQSAAAWYNVAETIGCGNASSDRDEVLASMRSKDWETVLDAKTGNFTKRPLLIGSNDNEVGLFRVTFGLQNVTYSDATWNYPQQQIFTCPIGERALASAANNYPVWRYRYFGNFPNLKLSTDPDSGAWHGSEVCVIFGTDEDVQHSAKRTPEEEKFEQYMRGAWAAFAKDPERGLLK
jgi:cholinesterase